VRGGCGFYKLEATLKWLWNVDNRGISMKMLMVSFMLAISVLANAGGNQLQMQGMMKKAQEMQACMQHVDQSKMHDFQQRGQQMAKEVKALCAAGKRTQALAKAMAYSQKMAADPALQEMKKCAEIMKGLVPGMMELAKPYMDEKSGSHNMDEPPSSHICDE